MLTTAYSQVVSALIGCNFKLYGAIVRDLVIPISLHTSNPNYNPEDIASSCNEFLNANRLNLDVIDVLCCAETMEEFEAIWSNFTEQLEKWTVE